MKNNVKEERLKAQITQQALADSISVSRQTIFAIEVRKYVPSTILALKIASVLNKSVHDLFALEATD